MEDCAFSEIDDSEESMEEAENWEAEEEMEKICTEDDIHHNNFSLGYFHEGLPSFMKDGCYFGGYSCRDCKKKFVPKITLGNEEKEYRPTPNKPVHACTCIQTKRYKCEHAYCHPCFIPHLADCGNTKDSPRKKRGAAVYNIGP